MPTYNLIPNPTDDPSQSQALLKENFESLQIIIEENHVDFNSGNAGKHKKVVMPEQAADPVLIDNEMALYTKEVSGSTQLFLAREGAAGAKYNLSSVVATASGRYSLLPSGVKYQWGTATSVTGTGNTAVTLPVAMANTSYSVVVTQQNIGGPSQVLQYIIVAKSTTSFTIQPNRLSGLANNYTFSWIAIGE